MRLLKKLPIHPTFFLLLIWFICAGQAAQFFVLFFVVLLHEAGHYLVAKRLGYKLNGFYLAPYGVALNYKEGKFLPKDEIMIALAGPCVNIILSLFLSSLWWICPPFYSFTYDICMCSMFLALFNLLPAYPLDGGRVLVSALSEKLTRKKALKISIGLNIFFSILFFVAFVITCFVDYNPTLALMVVFLLCGVIETKFEGKYERMNIFKKEIKNFSAVKSVYVKGEASLSELLKAVDQSKLTIFYVEIDGKIKIVTEKKIISLCLNNPLSTKFKDLNL